MPRWKAWPVRVPSIIKWWYPNWYEWDKPSGDKTLYLTFDDGPIPGVTEWVLDTLERHNVKATFFCIGENVKKHPTIFNRILDQGHSVGNHSMHHLKGSQTKNDSYIDDILKAEKLMRELRKEAASPLSQLNFPLFRPPYGRIKKSQAKALRALGYRIIMYRIIAYDWKTDISPERCLANICQQARSGDLIVLHDSLKAATNMKYALTHLIPYFKDKGFAFKTL